MKNFSKIIVFKTDELLSFKNITEELDSVITESRVNTGLASVFVQHTTAGLWLNENEIDLKDDIADTLKQIINPDDSYKHSRNSYSHQWQLLVPPSITIPIQGGKPAFGTWQGLFLVELDEGGYQERNLVFTIMGE